MEDLDFLVFASFIVVEFLIVASVCSQDIYRIVQVYWSYRSTTIQNQCPSKGCSSEIDGTRSITIRRRYNGCGEMNPRQGSADQREILCFVIVHGRIGCRSILTYDGLKGAEIQTDLVGRHEYHQHKPTSWQGRCRGLVLDKVRKRIING